MKVYDQIREVDGITLHDICIVWRGDLMGYYTGLTDDEYEQLLTTMRVLEKRRLKHAL